MRHRIALGQECQNQEFWDWRDLVANGQLFDARTNCDITMFTRDYVVAFQWEIKNAWPASIEIDNWGSGGPEHSEGSPPRYARATTSHCTLFSFLRTRFEPLDLTGFEYFELRSGETGKNVCLKGEGVWLLTRRLWIRVQEAKLHLGSCLSI